MRDAPVRPYHWAIVAQFSHITSTFLNYCVLQQDIYIYIYNIKGLNCLKGIAGIHGSLDLLHKALLYCLYY